MKVFKTKTAGIAMIAIVVLLIAGLILRSAFSGTTAEGAGTRFVMKSICGSDHRSPCLVGATGPSGGTIFFVDDDNQYAGFNYLEVAPSNWADDAGKNTQTFIWCDVMNKRIQITSNNWSSRRVGVGEANTALMLASCSDGAANAVHDYALSGKTKFNDWFLPSIGEIMLLTVNLQGLGGLLAEDYWSSSEFSNDGAWAQSVGHGYQGSATKDTTFYVRPVRSF